ncbi:DUF7256 domain-containing protein [Rhizobium phaseoli]|uniref:DUF7256 domain-containing protein n=1 Tax=Rhizobium phaseoli TaxID=396 RepID=UPI003CCAB59D
MGSVWRTPAPHKGDLIDVLAKTDGVNVRTERKGSDRRDRFEFPLHAYHRQHSRGDIACRSPRYSAGNGDQ